MQKNMKNTNQCMHKGSLPQILLSYIKHSLQTIQLLLYTKSKICKVYCRSTFKENKLCFSSDRPHGNRVKILIR